MNSMWFLICEWFMCLKLSFRAYREYKRGTLTLYEYYDICEGYCAYIERVAWTVPTMRKAMERNGKTYAE